MKDLRQAKILELISSNNIETQDELMRALDKVGIGVTQATISRDIKELGLTKIKGAEDKYYYSIIDAQIPQGPLDRMLRLLRNSITGVDYTTNLVIIKTISGGAQAAAAALDSLEDQNIVGTIAGDDTVLIIMRQEEDVAPVVSRLQQLIT